MIEASPHDAGTVYVAVERHRLDDSAPYIFKTSDFGKTWTSIVSGIPAGAYVHAVREDPKRKGLLYAGTERGTYVSFDDGANWQSLQLNLPVSPVNDLVVHDRDLVAATHGRSFWVLDDLSPLRQYKPELASEDVHLYTPSAASHTTFGGGFGGGAGAVGQNPPGGAVIYYSLKTALKTGERKKPATTPEAPAATGKANPEGKEPGKDQPPSAPEPPKSEPSGTETDAAGKNAPITLEILDQKGQVVRRYPPKRQPQEEETPEEGFGRRQNQNLPAEAGLNRFVWDLRYEGASRVPRSPLWAGTTDGPVALP